LLPDKMATRKGLLALAEHVLRSAGIEEAGEEARRILEDVLGIKKQELCLAPGAEVPESGEKCFLKIIDERKTRKPLAYLLKRAYFRNESLFVNEACLIPRPETEILVDSVARQIINDEEISILDIGTGPGTIAVSLLRMLPKTRATLLDISGEALDAAGRNLGRYGLQDRAKLVKGDLFSAFDEESKWDVIVSNPPYLTTAELENAQPELKFEPECALDGGKDGLDFYRIIVPSAWRHLGSGGLLAFEVGAGQAETVSTWLRDAGYDNIQRFRDYLQIERVVIARKP